MARRRNGLGAVVVTIIGLIWAINALTGRPTPAPPPADIQYAPPGIASSSALQTPPASLLLRRTMYVTASSLNVRRSASANAPALFALANGATVVVTSEDGDWAGIALTDGSTGWVSRRYLSLTRKAVSAPSSSTAPPTQPATAKQKAYNRDQVVRAVMARSLAGYSGRCPCPDNVDRAGRRCGGRSAYSRAGGYGPLCYPTDVTQKMIDDYVAEQQR